MGRHAQRNATLKVSLAWNDMIASKLGRATKSRDQTKHRT